MASDAERFYRKSGRGRSISVMRSAPAARRPPPESLIRRRRGGPPVPALNVRILVAHYFIHQPIPSIIRYLTPTQETDNAFATLLRATCVQLWPPPPVKSYTLTEHRREVSVSAVAFCPVSGSGDKDLSFITVAGSDGARAVFEFGIAECKTPVGASINLSPSGVFGADADKSRLAAPDPLNLELTNSAFAMHPPKRVVTNLEYSDTSDVDHKTFSKIMRWIPNRYLITSLLKDTFPVFFFYEDFERQDLHAGSARVAGLPIAAGCRCGDSILNRKCNLFSEVQ
ncbi:hypothetical protein EVAR_80539_1 [Eumeta japonica]|uniref:Uncharacterized protein n=1 Tax=Eumeta variegata TaxID=151549 RepID=A0A4C1TLA4_EUMVA|nr:hypothetical protein EVAR_80539_1 [Eumeta japonica]